jgi:hypothetical protein
MTGGNGPPEDLGFWNRWIAKFTIRRTVALSGTPSSSLTPTEITTLPIAMRVVTPAVRPGRSITSWASSVVPAIAMAGSFRDSPNNLDATAQLVRARTRAIAAAGSASVMMRSFTFRALLESAAPRALGPGGHTCTSSAPTGTQPAPRSVEHSSRGSNVDPASAGHPSTPPATTGADENRTSNTNGASGLSAAPAPRRSMAHAAARAGARVPRITFIVFALTGHGPWLRPLRSSRRSGPAVVPPARSDCQRRGTESTNEPQETGGRRAAGVRVA